MGADARKAAEAVVAKLRAEGHEAFFAGGWVRDHLLGVEAAADVDVATSASPDAVEALFGHTVAVGKQFGVVVVLDFGASIEVATFRSDGAYVDGRRPSEVYYGTIEADAARRDFSINGMYFDPDTEKVIDLVGGLADLEAKSVRAIGDARQRFAEDQLRLLRAVRFAARLGFEIEAGTEAAIRELAGDIGKVSAERIGDELVKMITHPSARTAVEGLSSLGLLGEVIPELETMRGVEQGKLHHPEGDVWTHVMIAMERLGEEPERSEALAWGVLLHDVAKPLCAGRREDGGITFYGHCEQGAAIAKDICARLRRPKAVIERAAWLVANHLRHVQAASMRPATLKRFLRQEGIDELLTLCRIDALASSGDLQAWNYCQEQLANWPEEAVRPRLLLNGRDLKTLGHTPGPRFAEILAAVEDAQLEGRLGDREAAFAFVRDRFPSED